jgi:hypothetical protein
MKTHMEREVPVLQTDQMKVTMNVADSGGK